MAHPSILVLRDDLTAGSSRFKKSSILVKALLLAENSVLPGENSTATASNLDMSPSIRRGLPLAGSSQYCSLPSVARRGCRKQYRQRPT